MIAIYRKTFDEDLADLPELTCQQQELMDSFDFEQFWETQIEPCLPPQERKPWRVTDKWGNTIKRYKTKEEAMQSAIERNRRARELGIHMRYRCAKSRGYEE